jgi:hypothetical protein
MRFPDLFILATVLIAHDIVVGAAHPIAVNILAIVAGDVDGAEGLADQMQ